MTVNSGSHYRKSMLYHSFDIRNFHKRTCMPKKIVQKMFTEILRLVMINSFEERGSSGARCRDCWRSLSGEEKQERSPREAFILSPAWSRSQVAHVPPYFPIFNISFVFSFGYELDFERFSGSLMDHYGPWGMYLVLL